MKTPESILSSAKVARTIAISEATLKSRINAGLIVPDFVVEGSELRGGVACFLPTSVESVRRAVFGGEPVIVA